MPRERIITSLDIGTGRVRMVMAQENRANDSLQVLGAVDVESMGVNKGIVVNIDEATTAVSHCLSEAEQMIGRPIESVWVGMSGGLILSQMSKGVVAIARSSGEIREDDLLRAVDAAKMVASPPNYENLHALIQGYAVDNQIGIKDPVGMRGIRLEVDTTLIMALSSHRRNIQTAVYRAGVSIDDIVFGPLAAAEGVLNQKQRDLGVALVDIGSATTKVVVFEEGNLIKAVILRVGAEHITSDIAIGHQIPHDLAEAVKIEYGHAFSSSVSKKDVIQLSEFDETVPETISRREMAEYIEARVEEIVDMVDTELRKIKRSGRLPAGVVFVGGGANLSGVTDVAKKSLRLPASLGYPKEMVPSGDKVNNLSFATALGLIHWARERESIGRLKAPFIRRMSGGLPFLKKIADFFRL